MTLIGKQLQTFNTVWTVISPTLVNKQGLIPDIDPASISIDLQMELDDAGDALSKDQPTTAVEPSGRAVVVKSNDTTEQTDTRAAKMRRTVYQVL